MRRHLTDYVKGFPGASGYRSRLTSVSTLEEVHAILDEIAAYAAAQGLAVAV